MQLNIISKYRNQIYGAAILWIVLFHAINLVSVDFTFGIKALTWFHLLMKIGNLGVDIFLFLSGVYLYFSFTKDNDIYSFIKKRLARIVPPFLLFWTGYYVYKYLMVGDVAGFIERITLVKFWLGGDNGAWFISFILAAYFVYPYLYKYLFSRKNDILRFVILMVIVYATIIAISIDSRENWWNYVNGGFGRIPVFLMGVWLGKYVYENKQLPKICIPLVFLVVIAFGLALISGKFSGVYMRFLYGIGGVSVAYAFAYIFFASDKIKPTKTLILKPLAFLGAISLELYLSHMVFSRILRIMPFYEQGNFLQYFTVIVLSIIAAWLGHKLCSYLSKRFSLKPAT